MRIAPALFALILSIASGCSRDQSQETKITLTGASTIAPLMVEVGKAFEAEHPGVRVDVQTGGSSRGVADARSGLADIGLVSRSLKSDESDLIGFVIARDGVCIILHKDNPVAALSDKQIVDIYLGRITDWSEAGGTAGAIVVVNKAEGRSTLQLFTEHFRIKNSDIKASAIIGDNRQGIKTVAGNPAAIGYVSIGTAEYDSTHGVPIKLLPMNGVAATSANVRGGKFPLARPLTLATKGEPAGKVRELIAFAKASRELILEQGFVPLD